MANAITHYEIHPLAELIPNMTDDEFAKLKEDIEGIGQIEPIVLYQGQILDGRHRYRACCELGIEPIVTERNLDGMSLIDAVRSLNILRRHLTVSQRAMVAVRFLDYVEQRAKERQRAGARKSPNPIESGQQVRASLPTPSTKRASDEIAEEFGVGGRTIRDAKTVSSKGTPEEQQVVVSGEAAVSKVAKTVREREKSKTYAEVQAFNRTNDSAIEWAKYTWNPVTGCEHGCKYCYARGIAERRMGAYKDIGFKPHLHEERLSAPRNTKLPEKTEDRFCFVVSMGDLFGKWVPDEWIIKVFDEIKNAPEWTFLLLTKNPGRYVDLCEQHGEDFFPKNAWLGASAANQEQADKAVAAFDQLYFAVDNVKFLSCEPLQEHVSFATYNDDRAGKEEEDSYYETSVDWVIVGAQSNPDVQPEWEWVQDIVYQCHETRTPLYFKPNLTVRPKDKPTNNH